MKPMLILFDLGGVLFEYKKFLTTFSKEQKVDRDLILHTLGRYAKEANVGKITLRDVYLKCIEENDLKSDKNYDIELSWVKDLVKIETSYNFICEVSKKYDVGLLSNIFKHFVPLIIERNIIPNIEYKYKFLSCDIGLKKPDAEIYEHVNKKTALEPGKILFIDDFEENIQAAREHGWQTHLFSTEKPKDSVNTLSTKLFQ